MQNHQTSAGVDVSGRKGRQKMSEFEISFPIANSQYNEVIILDKYGDNYSLIAGQKGKTDGKLYKRWCFPQAKDKKPSEKSIPLKITLGNRKEAIEMLMKLLDALDGQRPAKPAGVGINVPSEQDIPF